MNLPGDDLFKLIKSLTPSEKRYFRMLAEKQGEKENKTYLKIFDIIDGMDGQYDEEKLKTKLKSAADIKMLPQLKIYLNDHLLKSMRLYRADKNVFTEITDMIQDELFFTEKGLVELRAKVLKRSKEMAYKHDLLYLVLAILQREKTYSLLYSGKQPLDAIRELHQEETGVLANLNMEANLAQISYSLWAQYLIDPLLNDPDALEQYNAYKNDPVLQDADKLQTFNAKWNFIRAHCLICRLNNDNQTAIAYYKQAIELFDEYPQHKFNVNGSYIDALNNYLGACHRAGFYDDFEEVISKLEQVKSERVMDQVTALTYVCSNKILYIMNTGKFELADEVINDYNNLNDRYSKMVSNSHIVSNAYNIALILFIMGRYKEALDYCERILRLNTNTRQELQHGAKVLYLILHYELDNKLYLDSLIRNTSRAMQKEERFDYFEKLVMKYLRLLIKALKEEKKEIYCNMYQEILSLRQSQENFKFVIMSEILGWLKSKIDGRPLTDTINDTFE